MQSMEAAISLLVFLSISAFLVPLLEEQRDIDDSLYRAQLAEDAWRVLYLRGDFRDFGDDKRGIIESDMAEITRQTSLCVFMDGVRFTSCRGTDASHEITISLSRTAIYNGTPRSFTFALGK